MPAVAAHYYFGQEVLKLLPEEIQSTINENKSAFNLGLQGPDLFFYFKPLKKNYVTEYAHRIHSTAADYIISNAVNVIKENHDKRALSYLFGFACHFILDSGLHGKISEIAPGDTCHKFLEAEIDRQIIQKHFNSKSNKYKRYKLAEININAAFWLQNIYAEMNAKDIKISLRGFMFYMKILFFGKTFISLAERILKKEGEFSSMIINMEKDETYYNAAYELCGKLNELKDQGVKAVLNINSNYYGKSDLSELFNLNFL